MAAPVPAIERANRIVQRMAQAPRERFTSAELAAQTDIHRATCFSILSCLASLGIVYRDPTRKTYSLGAELLRLGAATADQFTGVQKARREMFRLAEQLDVGGLLCAPLEQDFVVIDSVGREIADFQMPQPEHTLVPLAPPIGAIFVAWSSPEAINAWVGRAPASASPADIESYRRSVAAVRARGYSIGSETEVEVQLGEILERLTGVDADQRLAVALELADLVRTRTPAPGAVRSPRNPPIGHLIGPIFDDTGQVALTVTIFARPGQIDSDNLDQYVKRLLAACERATRGIGGRMPDRSATGQSLGAFGSG